MLCHCGTRLDVPGYRAGFSSAFSISAAWNTLKNLSRLSESRVKMAAEVARIEHDLERLSELSISGSAFHGSAASSKAKEIAASCVEVTQQAQSYRSWMRLTEADSAVAAMECWINVAPGRYHVTQRVDADWDEWITIEDTHYRNAGLWMSMDPEADNAHQRNRSMSTGAYLRLMDAAGTITCAACEGGGDISYFLLDFEGEELPVIRQPEPVSFRTRVWIEENTRLMAKAQIPCKLEYRGTRRDFVLDQMFTSYGDRVSIWAPHLNVAAPTEAQGHGKGSAYRGRIVSNKVETVPRWGIVTNSIDRA